MVIDTHVHFFADSIVQAASERLRGEAGIPGYTDFTEADTRRKLKEWGVDLGVVVPVATKPSQQRTINDWAATLQHDGLISFGAIHPLAGDAVEELHRIQELGLHGVKLHPDYQDYFVDDERAFPLYEEVGRLGLPMVIHAGWDPVSPELTHAPPEKVARVHRLFPKLKLVAAHMGGFRMYDDVEKYIVGTDIYIDISMSALVCGGEQFARIIKNHGAEKVLFASDCPWSTPPREMAMLDRAGLTADEMELILHKNAARLMNLPAQYQ